MDQNVSMIRFLMFMILALIIFFNIAPQIVHEEGDKDSDTGTGTSTGTGTGTGTGTSTSTETGTSTDTGSDAGSDTGTAGNYCLIDAETHADKRCKEISSGDSCQNRFASLEECEEWKGALDYDTVLAEDGSLNYVYATDDIDKMTIMTSDDMIYCLKNNKECEKMDFGDCHDIHIGTYLDEGNCEEAKNNLSGSTYDEKTYCLSGNECINTINDNSNNCLADSNGDKIEYCNMNQCKSNNSGATGAIDGEYCFNGSSCDQMSCSDTSCDGKYYTSLSTCKSNNGLS